MAGKNKKSTPNEESIESKIMRIVFAIFAIILIISLVLSAFVTY